MLTVGIYGIRDITITDRPSFVHDHSITFMRNGRVLSTIMLERYTGIKHDQRLGQFITEILDKWVDVDEPVRFVSVNSFIGSAFVSDDGTFRIEPLEEPSIENILTPAKVLWFRNGKLKNYDGWVMCHEFAHIASALPFGVTFDDQQLLVHIDGGASKSACSFWQMDGKNPQLLHSSWSDLKDPVNNFNVGLLGRTILGLSANEHLAIPGKLMGFAAYGKPDTGWYQHLIHKRFYLGDEWNKETMLQDLAKVNGNQVDISNLNNHLPQTLAACIQRNFEENIFKTICNFKKDIHAKDLVYAGGAALNIPTNALLEQEFGCGHVFIPPCTNDSGLSLGAAAWVEYINGNEIYNHEPFINNFDVPNTPPSFDAIFDVAKGIAEGKIVALCTGGSEIGPRALGHRSILARPDNVELKTKVSEQVKKREWYRPIAPALLPDVAANALKSEVKNSKLAPYMLGSYVLDPTWQEKFAGVLHVDGTLRAQIVADSPENIFFYKLLEILNSKYNIAGVINTSFNIKGDPIVHYHQKAMEAATNMGIDMVVIHGSLHYT
ncbi:MAG: Carbamoyltransferase family protein [uncultured bacterium]|nr:MAG: Carbamoyltransferase family protein [uncultured bacterium]